MARTHVLCVGVCLLGVQVAASEPQAGRGAQRPVSGAQRPAAAAPALAGKGAQMLSVIYPTDRPMYGQGVLMAMAFLPMGAMDNAAASDKLQKELDTFIARHKLKPPFMREPAELFQGVDLPVFISESMLFLKSHAKKGEDPGLPVPSGKPEDVKITGETAVAMLNGKEVKFARISNRWFIRLE